MDCPLGQYESPGATTALCVFEKVGQHGALGDGIRGLDGLDDRRWRLLEPRRSGLLTSTQMRPRSTGYEGFGRNFPRVWALQVRETRTAGDPLSDG